MNHLKLITEELKEDQPRHVFTFDDQVLAALASNPAIKWCAENASQAPARLLEGVASIYKQADYRGGPTAPAKARAAFLRILPGGEALYDQAKPIDFKVKHLEERGLPDSVTPTSTGPGGSVYFGAVRTALGEVFPDACRPSLGTAENLLRVVHDLLEGELRHNEMTDEIMVGDRALADTDISLFRTNVERRFISNKSEPLQIGKDTAWDAVTRAAQERGYHPVRDYLDALVWDGTPRLDRVATELLNSEFDLDVVRRIVRLWFIGCVARIYEPGCKMDTMLVLIAGQGVLKSTFFEAVAGPEFFTDTAIDFESKDALMVMRRAWIAEHSEMKSILAAKSEEEVKSGITRRVDEFRPPYGRATVRVPRHTVFGGTTNNRELLRDVTGNRRYWPVAVSTRIDIDRVREWRDQLWAEAVVAFRAEKKWWLAADDEAALREYQEEFTKVDVWETAVADYLSSHHGDVTLTGILSGALNIQIEKQDPKSEARAKATLTRLGWIEKRPRLKDGSRPRVWVRQELAVAPSNEPMSGSTTTGAV